MPRDDSDEERRERKRMKKERKKEKKEKKKKDPKLYQMVGYTNDNNPFGDSNLNQTFVWKKKAEREGESTDVNVRAKKEKQQHFYEEIQKVRQRRSQREAEQEEMERLRAEEARLREAEQYHDWHQKEEGFHLEQARVRSKIRLAEGREKPIDLLAKNIILLSNDKEEKRMGKTVELSHLEVELREPYHIFDDLSMEDLVELQGDIKAYRELEGEGPHKAFWQALELLCRKEIDDASGRKKDSGIHSSVMDDVVAELDGKGVAELDSQRFDIQRKIDQNDGSMDVEFLEGMLHHIQIQRARAVLMEQHREMLKRQLERLEEQRAELKRKREENPELFEQEEARRRQELEAAAAVAASEAERDHMDGSRTARQMVEAEREKGMDDLEEEMGLNEEITVQGDYWWKDKYRPRKPRYFNRVKTGYEWNKYNQTHYDHDNPPPKTVQGYKFNIFYPDLIDKTVTPRFVCEPADSRDFMILRFSAGPPYEDIAFKIVNREWEYGKKHGFKAMYERGIMHLYFNFKRYRYRK